VGSEQAAPQAELAPAAAALTGPEQAGAGRSTLGPVGAWGADQATPTVAELALAGPERAGAERSRPGVGTEV